MVSTTARSFVAVQCVLVLAEAKGNDTFWNYLDKMAGEGKESNVMGESGRYLSDMSQVYSAEMWYDDSECSGSPEEVWYFRKVTGSPDCFVYTDPYGEGAYGSVNVTCIDGTEIGKAAFYYMHDGDDCTGSVVGSGVTPWSWYTSGSCTTYRHYDPFYDETFVIHSIFPQALASGDYPSTCSSSEEALVSADHAMADRRSQ